MKLPRSETWIAIGLVTAAGVATCSEDTVGENTARDVMQELVTSIDSAMTDHAISDRVISIDCAQSGTRDVSGHAMMSAQPLAVDVAMRVTYRHCTTHDNRVFDGNIDFVQKLSASDPMRITTTYHGDVEVSGSVIADCPVDLEVVVDQQGRSLEMNGSVCHRDASTMDMTVTPLWNVKRSAN